MFNRLDCVSLNHSQKNKQKNLVRFYTFARSHVLVITLIRCLQYFHLFLQKTLLQSSICSLQLNIFHRHTYINKFHIYGEIWGEEAGQGSFGIWCCLCVTYWGLQALILLPCTIPSYLLMEHRFCGRS